MKHIIIDLDGTLTIDSAVAYKDKPVRTEVVAKLQEYKNMGFSITIATSRGMRTYKGDVGQINARVLPEILTWLARHNVPYDSIMVGKPWCGFDGFYIDDKAVRPSEFANMSYEEIQNLLAQENPHSTTQSHECANNESKKEWQ